jgi:TatD DNase family protein
VVENAKKAKISVIINNGLNPKSNRETIKLSKKYSIIKAALGLYPTDALQLTDKEIDEELKFIKLEKPIAIGECGLDFSDIDEIKKEKQIKTFEKQILLAKELNIPIIIHSRKAEFEVIDTLQRNNAKKVILHCFSGKKSLIKKAIELGYYFSIPANITRSAHFQELVKMVPLSQIFTETDSPFLSPNKDETNEPANITYSIKKIAELTKMTPEEIENSIFMNYQKLFS